ncbi:DNA helicase [Tanacetum coccineum]
MLEYTGCHLAYVDVKKFREKKKKEFDVELSFGKHLEEKHMTWDQFEKKREKIATLHEFDQENSHSFVGKTLGKRTEFFMIKFQKEGLPHCHSLIWISEATKIPRYEDVDRFISAELSDPIDHVVWPTKVLRYKRRNTDGYTDKKNLQLDNNYVVPYNRCRSFKDIRNIDDKVYPTNMAACEALGLLGDSSGVVVERFLGGDIPNRLSATLGIHEILDCLHRLKQLRKKLLMEEKNYNRAELMKEREILLFRLNREQKSIFDLTLSVVTNGNQQLIFVYGHGDLIIWDEAPINDRRCFETLEQTLRNVLDAPNVVFRGKSIMLEGEFRQTLLVKRKALKEEIISSSIVESYLWPGLQIHFLEQNMRLLQLDLQEHEIGTPDESNADDCSSVQMPNELCIPDDENGILELIMFIYDE